MRKSVSLETLPIFNVDVFKKSGLGYDYGFSVYRGVIVLWDEDYDVRIFIALDILLKTTSLEKPIMIRESEGVFQIVWHREDESLIKAESPDSIEVRSNETWDSFIVENIFI